MRPRLAPTIALSLLWGPTAASATLISGQVQDRDSGQGLPAATIQIKGTYQGTVANDNGAYTLKLSSYPAVLRVTYIGYHSKEITLEDSARTTVDIRLDPAPIAMPEMIVTDQDPAERIMAEVIRRKQQWRPRIQRFNTTAHTRATFESDGQIAAISEVVSSIYWDREQGWREVVKSRHTTRNLAGPNSAADVNLGSVDSFFNLYDDQITILEHQVIAPTHPQALKHYHFKLIGQRRLDEKIVYDIAATPKNSLQSALIGRLAVLDQDFALLEAQLRPAKHIIQVLPIPFVNIDSLNYRQQFRPFADGVWLPVDFKSQVEARVNFMQLLKSPALKFSSASRLADYALNIDLPDTIYADSTVVQVDTLSVQHDSLFARYPDKVPLSPREQTAYAKLDSTKPMEELVKFSGPLARYVEAQQKKEKKERQRQQKAAEVPTWRQALPQFTPILHYNRVDQLHLGLEAKSKTYKAFSFKLGAGYSTGPEQWAHRLALDYGWGPERRGFFQLAHSLQTQPRYRSQLYPPLLASAQPLLGLGDYFDYYRNNSQRISLGYAKGRGRLHLDLSTQDHSSLSNSTDFGLLGRRRQQRPNPAIPPGRLNSATLSGQLGNDYQPFGLGVNKRIQLKIEHSEKWMGSDYSFTRFDLEADWHLKTFLRRRFMPNALDLRLVAGLASGAAPPQRFAILEAGIGPLAPTGSFRGLRGAPYEGEHYAALFWEHNFKTVPFEFLGLWGLARRGFGLGLHGASGRTWLSDDQRAQLTYQPRYQDRFHHEVGLSLQVYHLFRLELTRRLDQGGWHGSFSLARLDFE